ncbi:MAG: TlpA family protein disulfide reductase [Clostridiales bacterium]|nr:TlpA family protein disulfide reductase [Clostridiales bacterium]
MKLLIQKFLLICLTVCLSAFCAAILLACNNREIEHGHSFGEYEVTVAAGCYTPGELTRTCTVCGYKETDTISASHVWTAFKVTLDADCYTPGEQTRKCTKCGNEEVKEIPKTEHDWSEFKVTTPATCKIVGEKTRNCSICGSQETENISKIEHNWSAYAITTPAKCLTQGEKTRVCSGCGDKETVPIPATGHSWSQFEITTQAKCLMQGEKTRACSGCGDKETVSIPATGHSWQSVEIIEPATCEDDGYQSAICSVCSEKSEKEIIPALGHTAGKVLPVIAPTCEEDGTNRVTCAVCSKGYNERVPATGHNYNKDFTIDKIPSLNSEGEQSRHCTNYKCSSRTDIQTIPKLVGEVYYRIYIVRGDRQALPRLCNPMIKIFDETGKAVATTFVFGNSDGEHYIDKLLPIGKYTVSIVSDLPTGFECGQYEVSERNGTYPYDTPDKYPTVTMHMYSHLGTGTMTGGDKKGTVLNDFSVTTIDGKTVWLSQLLQEKRLVWLNFYYNDCSNCKSETPTIIRVAQQYDVAVICFNGKDSLDQIRSGAKSIFNFPDSFYIVQDSGKAFGNMFGCYAYPLNVFIDSGGYVFESVTGSNYASQFNNFVSNNLFATPPKPDTASVRFNIIAILPEDRRYLR